MFFSPGTPPVGAQGAFPALISGVTADGPRGSLCGAEGRTRVPGWQGNASPVGFPLLKAGKGHAELGGVGPAQVPNRACAPSA